MAYNHRPYSREVSLTLCSLTQPPVSMLVRQATHILSYLVVVQVNKVFLKSAIEKAMKSGKLLAIDYVGKDLKLSRDRIIIPLEIRDDVLFANCLEAKGIRQFSFEGIMKIEERSVQSYGKD